MAYFTDVEANQFSKEHLTYELDMLRWSTVSLLNLKKDSSRNDSGLKFSKNSLVETFAIHSRNLIDFLFPPMNTRDTDVTVRDYLDKKDQQLIKQCGGILKDARFKADKQVAHLTTERISYEITGKEWSYLKIYNVIIDQFIAYKPYFVTSRMSPFVIDRLIKYYSEI